MPVNVAVFIHSIGILKFISNDSILFIATIATNGNSMTLERQTLERPTFERQKNNM